jgi:hypothetical protein
LTVLYTLFDKYQDARKLGNAKLIAIIQQYVTYPLVVRIEGQLGASLVEINTQMNPQSEGFNDITGGEFDFVIDEVDESPTQRMMIARILTDLNQNNPGMIPPGIILEYANAPWSVKQRVYQAYQAMMEAEERRKDVEAASGAVEAAAKHESARNKGGSK